MVNPIVMPLDIDCDSNTCVNCANVSYKINEILFYTLFFLLLTLNILLFCALCFYLYTLVS